MLRIEIEGDPVPAARTRYSVRRVYQPVFLDDSQICRCVVEKFTDKENPRAVIEVGAMDDT